MKDVYNFLYYQILLLLSLLDQPSIIMPDDTVSKTTKQKSLLELCEQFVERYVFWQSEVQNLVEQTQELQDDSDQPFMCRAEECEETYVYHSARVR